MLNNNIIYFNDEKQALIIVIVLKLKVERIHFFLKTFAVEKLESYII